MRIAREEATHYRTTWRMIYQLPPNDPRFLDATNDEILHDLLVQRFRDEAIAREADPKGAAVEEAIRDPRLAESLREEKRKALEDLEGLKRFVALAKGGAPKPAPAGVRLAGTVQPSRARRVQP